jgi:hypothetical protein
VKLIRAIFHRRVTRPRKGAFDNIAGGDAVGIPPDPGGGSVYTYFILGF